MPTDNRLLILPLTAIAVAVAALIALPIAGEAKAPELPKAPKVTHYPITIDAVGYVDYKWTYDDRSECLPGYSKTITEELSFELGRPRRTKLQIVGGIVVMPPVIGGSSVMHTQVSGFQTTNFCPPEKPIEIPPPECTPRLESKMVIGLGTEGVDSSEELVPLGRDTLAVIAATKPGAQLPSCFDGRPRIRTEKSRLGWAIEPPGLTIPTGILNSKLWKLKPGQKLTGRTTIGGGCGRASASASASRVNSSPIKSCTLQGKVIVTVKRIG